MTSLRAHGLTVDELFAPQMRCSYPSKVCHNPRAFKLCGSLHKLCEFHRKKANLNQKRLQQRRRVIRAQMTAHCTPFVAASNAPAMNVDLIQLFKSDSQQAVATTTNTVGASSSDDFSVFESSFLDNFMFVGGATCSSQDLEQAAPVGFYESYGTAISSDQAQATYGAFNFELQL
ncbi:hypothetical protein Gpo141_00007680 [Globisporangium polare]